MFREVQSLNLGFLGNSQANRDIKDFHQDERHDGRVNDGHHRGADLADYHLDTSGTPVVPKSIGAADRELIAKMPVKTAPIVPPTP